MNFSKEVPVGDWTFLAGTVLWGALWLALIIAAWAWVMHDRKPKRKPPSTHDPGND